MSNQRTAQDELPFERKERLEAVSGWAWDAQIKKWELGFRHLTEFAEHEGHCLVPQRYQTSDGFRLGVWVTAQRSKKDSLPPKRRERLEATSGWVWDVLEAQWEAGFRHLTEFVDREEHCRVPQNYQTSDGYRLGQWVTAQRTAKDGLPAERKERLEVLPAWIWDALADQWETGLRHLTEFADREGHCRVPANYRTGDGYSLSQWVKNQRKAEVDMPPDRKEQLEAAPGWVWGVFADQWETGFRHLTEFADREGHCRVPTRYKTSDGYSLGLWVGDQRDAKDGLSAERKERLEAVSGWVWDALADQWETGLCQLMEYADREGHCRVPAKYQTSDGYRLGTWVANQRAAKDGLPAERKERLETVQNWVWDALTDKWETAFRYLSEFSTREGHCNVPALFQTADGFRLGLWVRYQRTAMERLPIERKILLETLPGWVWRIREG